MARDVVTLRLGDAEKEAIAKAAAKQRLPFSEFLRQAALLVAHRLTNGVPQSTPEPEPEPQPPAQHDPHIVNTYSSFAEYQARSAYAWSGPLLPPGGQMRKID